ncbi:MAG: alpha-L-fucosidase [Lentisphaeria bacterium]|nr:alpha-L-fucosidase [Lentisphaeria bacterium]
MSGDITAAKTNQATIEWFRENKFGLFIHWGIYALIGRGEWVMHVEQIPVAEYEPLQQQFNPVKFDPAAWADLAKRTGMRYMVVTTKHHDGFCMWDTKQTDYNVMNTPYGKDIIGELSDAFQGEGLKVGLYHSVLDWHHYDYLPRRNWDTRPTDGAELKKYTSYMREQVREILDGSYGDVLALWYDMGGEHTAEEWESPQTNAMARELQPGILINGRAAVEEDLATPEQRVPPTGVCGEAGNPMLWEACITMTSHWWGYDAHETNFKTSEFLIRMLVDIVSKGGNLLLNIGPRPDGTIQEEFVERMEAIGRWLDVHGEAIYGTTASPFNLLPCHGRATVKDNLLYLHIFDWPGDLQLRLPNLKNKVKAAWMLDSGASLTARRSGADWIITLPDAAPDTVASVVAVELDGAPETDPVVVRPSRRGVVRLPALYGLIDGTHGQRIRYETEDGVVHIGNWIRLPDTASWTFTLPAAGVYRLALNMRVASGQGGSEIGVSINGSDEETVFKVYSTGGVFGSRCVATLDLPEGEVTLRLKPASIRREKVLDLRAVALRPM